VQESCARLYISACVYSFIAVWADPFDTMMTNSNKRKGTALDSNNYNVSTTSSGSEQKKISDTFTIYE